MVRAGDMRHLVRLEQRTQLQDAAGQELETWLLVAERRAAIQRTPGSEVWASAQRQGRVPTVFRLRYPVDLAAPIGPDMRLVHDGTVYDIVSAVDPAGIKEELLITAVAHLESAA